LFELLQILDMNHQITRAGLLKRSLDWIWKRLVSWWKAMRCFRVARRCYEDHARHRLP